MNLATHIGHFPAEDDTPRANEVRQQLARILGSAAFRVSLQLSRFLSFVVEATLAGQGDRIKAYTIAVEALGRRSDFDPQTDPIVRVEAGRLRIALVRYYSGAGRNDPLVIDLPRGAYVPTFRRRGAGSAQQSPATRLPVEPSAGSVRWGELAEQSRQMGDALRVFQDLLEIQRQQIAAVSAEIDSAWQTVTDWRALLKMADDYGVDDRPPQTHLPGAPPAQPDGAKTAAGSSQPSLPSDAIASTTTAFRLITLLDELTAQLLASQNLESAVAAILEATIHLHRPDFGFVQLLDERTNSLVICAQRGIGKRFLKAFERVTADDGCASGRALRDRAPIIVEDVLSDAEYSAFHSVAAEAGYRAVQSTPLIASNGRLVGAACTVFVRPHTPSRLDMLMTQLYTRLAADVIARLMPPGRSADRAHRAA